MGGIRYFANDQLSRLLFGLNDHSFELSSANVRYETVFQNTGLCLMAEIVFVEISFSQRIL